MQKKINLLRIGGAGMGHPTPARKRIGSPAK